MLTVDELWTRFPGESQIRHELIGGEHFVTPNRSRAINFSLAGSISRLSRTCGRTQTVDRSSACRSTLFCLPTTWSRLTSS